MTTEAALRDYYIDQIHRNGYVEMPFTDIDTQRVMDDFGHVIDEAFGTTSQHGQDVVDAFNIVMPGREHDSSAFLAQRRVGAINPYEINGHVATDNKDILHFTPVSAHHAMEYMRTRGGASVAMRRLIKNCVTIQNAVREHVRPIYEGLDIAGDMLDYNPERNVHVLRLLRYKATDGEAAPEQPTKPDRLAELHFDRSKFTAALWESHPGLVGTPSSNAYGDPDLTVEAFDASAERALQSPLTYRPGNFKFFAGAGYYHLPHHLRQRSGNVPPLLHGVTDMIPGQERDAIVCFMNERLGRPTDGWSTIHETDFNKIRETLLARQREQNAAQN